MQGTWQGAAALIRLHADERNSDGRRIEPCATELVKGLYIQLYTKQIQSRIPTSAFQVHMGLMAQHSMTTSRAVSELAGGPEKPEAAAHRSLT